MPESAIVTAGVKHVVAPLRTATVLSGFHDNRCSCSTSSRDVVTVAGICRHAVTISAEICLSCPCGTVLQRLLLPARSPGFSVPGRSPPGAFAPLSSAAVAVVQRCFRFVICSSVAARFRSTPRVDDDLPSEMSSAGAMKVRKPEPAEIEFKNMRFLITYRPTDATMDRFVEELKKHSVKDVVRVCDPTYNTSRLLQEGIAVMDLPFDDGTPPPEEVVNEWFNLLRTRFTTDPSCCVAVHCIAGLGRAPVLVALALIELGMKYEDAVELIREKRRGAINAKQLAYLERYHPKSRLKSRSNGHPHNCHVM